MLTITFVTNEIWGSNHGIGEAHSFLWILERISGGSKRTMLWTQAFYQFCLYTVYSKYLVTKRKPCLVHNFVRIGQILTNLVPKKSLFNTVNSNKIVSEFWTLGFIGSQPGCEHGLLQESITLLALVQF